MVMFHSYVKLPEGSKNEELSPYSKILRVSSFTSLIFFDGSDWGTKGMTILIRFLSNGSAWVHGPNNWTRGFSKWGSHSCESCEKSQSHDGIVAYICLYHTVRRYDTSVPLHSVLIDCIRSSVLNLLVSYCLLLVSLNMFFVYRFCPRFSECWSTTGVSEPWQNKRISGPDLSLRRSNDKPSGPKAINIRMCHLGNQHSHGKSPFAMGKLTISMAMFNSKLLVITRG